MPLPGPPYERLARWCREYGGRPLGGLGGEPWQRLLLYLLLACLFFLLGLSAWAIFMGPGFLVRHMALSTVYSLHAALAYTLGHLAADLVAPRLAPAWGGWPLRTVGRQWLIWGGGLLPAFVLHRTVVRCLMHVYAPQVVRDFLAHPTPLPGHGTMFLVVLPFWLLASALAIQFALAMQAQALPRPEAVGGEMGEEEKEGALDCRAEAGPFSIPFARISHVSVEDHYSRIFFDQDHGQGPRNLLIRVSLKELKRKLPPARFVQVHRSHLVNLDQVARLVRKGRDHMVEMSPHGARLPVSRHRLGAVRQRLGKG